MALDFILETCCTSDRSGDKVKLVDRHLHDFLSVINCIIICGYVSCLKKTHPVLFPQICFLVFKLLNYDVLRAGPLCNATWCDQLLGGEDRRSFDSSHHRGAIWEKHLYVQPRRHLCLKFSFALLISLILPFLLLSRFLSKRGSIYQTYAFTKRFTWLMIGGVFCLFFSAFIRSDNENGEKSVQQAPSNLVPPALPPKPGTVSINRKTHISGIWTTCTVCPPCFPLSLNTSRYFRNSTPTEIFYLGAFPKNSYTENYFYVGLLTSQRDPLYQTHTVFILLTYFKSNISSMVRYSGRCGNAEVFFFGGVITLWLHSLTPARHSWFACFRAFVQQVELCFTLDFVTRANVVKTT